MSYSLLRLHIEHPNTPVVRDKQISLSAQGHTWYELIQADGTSFQAGFGPQDPKTQLSSVPGQVVKDDGRAYLGEPTFTSNMIVDEKQAQTLQDFALNPGKYGFDINQYNALTNSCVDFVTWAMSLIGLLPKKSKGAVLPMSNVAEFSKLKNPLFPDMSPFVERTAPWSSMWGLGPNHYGMGSFWTYDPFFDAPQGTITIGPLGSRRGGYSGW